MKYLIWNSILLWNDKSLSPPPESHRFKLQCSSICAGYNHTNSCRGKHHLRVCVCSTEGKKPRSSVVSPRTAVQSEQVTLMPSRSNSADFRKITARINLALHNKNENFTAAEQLSVPYLLWVDIKHQRRNTQYGLFFFIVILDASYCQKIEIFS